MSSRGCSSGNRGALAGSRPQSLPQPHVNLWHAPPGLARPARPPRTLLSPAVCAAVDHDLDTEDANAGRGRPRHGLDGDLAMGMELVPEIITPRKAMNRQLKKCETLLQLRILLESEYHAFDATNTSHALNLLVKMSRALLQQLRRAGLMTAEGAARHRAEHIAPCLSIIDLLVRNQADQFDAWGVSLCLWSYATLDHWDRQLFDLLCGRALQLTASLKPSDCAKILLAFGRWGHYQPELLKALPQALLDQMYDAKPEEISQTLWGFARLRVSEAPGRAFLSAVCETVAANMHTYGNQELTTVMWSLAKLHYYPGRDILQHAEATMLRRLRVATADNRPIPDIASFDQRRQRMPLFDLLQQDHPYEANGNENGAWHVDQPDSQQQQQPQAQQQHTAVNGHGRRVGASGAAGRHRPRPAPSPSSLRPQDISVFLWVCGQLRYKAAHLLDELPLCLGAWLPQFTTNDICSLLSGYANARHYHRGVLEAVAPLLAQRMHTLTISELVSTLWAYGIFQHRPASEPRFLSLLSTNLLARLDSSTAGSGPNGARPQTYALIAKSCANLRFRPEELLQQVVDASALRLHDFRPDEMSNLLYGISYLASRAPSCKLPQPIGGGRAAVAAAADPWHAAPVVTPSGAVQGHRMAADEVIDDGEPLSGEGHPMLQPDEMQLFYGVVRQCMRLLDEPNHPYGSRKFMHHQVLNSIIHSCLRIGYTPWALIDFAESKGMRLVQPKEQQQEQPQGRGSPAQPAPPAALATVPGRARSGHFMRPPSEFDKPQRLRQPSELDTAAGRARWRRGEAQQGPESNEEDPSARAWAANRQRMSTNGVNGDRRHVSDSQGSGHGGYNGASMVLAPRMVVGSGLDEEEHAGMQQPELPPGVRLLNPALVLGVLDGGSGTQAAEQQVRLERKAPPVLRLDVHAWQETGKG